MTPLRLLVERVEFWSVLIGVLLTPSILLLVGLKQSRRLALSYGDAYSEPQELGIARLAAWICVAVPFLQQLLGLWPSLSRNLGTTLWIGLPALGAFAGLCAAVLFLINGKGLERFSGSLAALIGSGLAVLSFFAGTVAA
jgi:hypothetical protein